MRWWKALFFHLPVIDIAVVNSFLLFREHQSNFPNNKALKRTADYSLANFCEEIVRDICGFQEYMNPPVSSPVSDSHEFETAYVPVMTAERKTVWCATNRAEVSKECRQSAVSSSVISVHVMHITQNKNCFQISTPGHIKTSDFV